MTNYRRIHTPGATWFFTANLAERNNNALLIDNIASLRQSFRYVKQQRSFTINAVVALPDHLHTIWTLPDDDFDYSTRWNLLKGNFSRTIDKGEGYHKAEKENANAEFGKASASCSRPLPTSM